jgi:hypothetical protein
MKNRALAIVVILGAFGNFYPPAFAQSSVGGPPPTRQNAVGGAMKQNSPVLPPNKAGTVSVTAPSNVTPKRAKR